MKICTAGEMRRLDEKTIHECGIPGAVLMENAGRGAAAMAAGHFGLPRGKSVAIVCGKGNNGGDGFVIGRIFHGWGARVRFFLLGHHRDVRGDARINLDVCLKMGLEIVEIIDESHLEQLRLTGCDLIVDAILGTGLNSEVRSLYRDVIDTINQSGAPVLAVDVPSGLNSDNGRIMGVAVRADMTVTFGLPKIGLFTLPGEELAGKVEVVDIGIPPHVFEEADPGKELLLEENLRGILPSRPLDSHKGRFGHLLIVAGSTGKTGAAALAAMAAARTGAGLITVAVPENLNAIMEVKITEAMTEPLPEESPGFLAAEAADRILELCQGRDALALGPGLGTNPGAVRVVERLLRESEIPLIIDADGLNALVGRTELLKQARADITLTPHPGEMSRLTPMTVKKIQDDRLGLAREFAENYGVHLVLKGYRTVVAAPAGRLYLNTTGGPHMASGGMGDVLTGVIAGLASQGTSMIDACRLGVYAHGLAADLASRASGPVGVLASDLMKHLPGLWVGFR